jgi:hypothetical protein
MNLARHEKHHSGMKNEFKNESNIIDFNVCDGIDIHFLAYA